MPTNPTPKRPRGRPPKPDAERLSARFELRLTEAEEVKVKALGGNPWLREQIRRAKLPG